MACLEFLRSLFSHELKHGIPVFEVEFRDRRFEVLPGKFEFWLQLSFSVTIQAITTILTTCMIYRGIIRNRGSPTSYIIGYGLLPIVFALPFRIIETMRIQNMCVMVALASIPLFVAFQSLAAMFGTNPPFAEKNLETYLLYCVPIIPFRFDSKTGRTIPTTSSEIQSNAIKVITIGVLTIAAYSVMIPCNYEPFPTPRELHTNPQTILEFFHWGHILNNYAVAFITGLSLSGGTVAFSLLTNLVTGRSTIKVMEYPLFLSTSVAEFWGKRWNKLVHQLVKSGIYKPTRKVLPAGLAVLASFAASGLLHEYVLNIIAMKSKLYASTGNIDGVMLYAPKPGSHMIFFLWNGFVLLCEVSLSGIRALRRIRGWLPRPVLTLLVLLTVLPISHLFTDEYIVSGFYSDYSVGFPKVVRTA